MLINKIIVGYVVQTWDTKKKLWISQKFIDGEESWENQNGEPLEEDPDEPDPLPCDLVQPKQE